MTTGEEVIPEDEMMDILDGGSIGLIWKQDNRILEFNYTELEYPKSIPFPEVHKLGQ